MFSLVKTVAMFFQGSVSRKLSQVFIVGQNGFLGGICNDCHKLTLAIGWIGAAPVRITGVCVAVYRPRNVNELHGPHTPSLSYVEGAILVISSSKANGICVDFLPGS